MARRRRTLLLKKAEYQEVPELEQALGLLEGEKFDKMSGLSACNTLRGSVCGPTTTSSVPTAKLPLR